MQVRLHLWRGSRGRSNRYLLKSFDLPVIPQEGWFIKFDENKSDAKVTQVVLDAITGKIEVYIAHSSFGEFVRELGDKGWELYRL